MSGYRIAEEFLVVLQANEGLLELRKTNNDSMKAQYNGIGDGRSDEYEEDKYRRGQEG
jgi:hypothetical protein